MAKKKHAKAKRPSGEKPTREQHPPAGGINQQLSAQNRKLLGKHYANKYRVGS
jgi:hypothetical protein